MELWERIKQEKAIEQAGIEGLEVLCLISHIVYLTYSFPLQSCPFCSYSVVIENEQERLFRCESEECGIVSCRACKKEVRFSCMFLKQFYQSHPSCVIGSPT